jgi:hypothetical protein
MLGVQSKGLKMSVPKTQDIATHLANSLDMSSIALKSASSLEASKSEDQRDIPVRQILERCAEFARASATLGRDNNPASLSILARATLENLILILWVIVSVENAEELKNTAVAELTRAARVNLQSGKLKIKNRKTGEDATAKFLADDRFKNLSKRKSVESRAKDAGVLDLYNVFYRFMSLETHGHDMGINDISSEWDLSVMHMQGIGALIKAIGHAGTLWLLHRQRVNNETLRVLFGIATNQSQPPDG